MTTTLEGTMNDEKITRENREKLLFKFNLKEMGTIIHDVLVDDYIRPADPNTYYRLERGVWGQPGWDGRFLSIVNNLNVRDTYVWPVSKGDVFRTFCGSDVARITDYTGNPVRLFFNEMRISNLNEWIRANRHALVGDVISVIRVETRQPALLAEEYIKDYNWENNRGEMIVGCPPLAMARQGVMGREYVIQPDNMKSLAAKVYNVKSR